MKERPLLGFLGNSEQFFFANGDRWLNSTSVFLLLTVTCVIGPLREGKNFFIQENFYEEFERYVKKRPCKRAALFIGTLLGKLEVVRLLGPLREKEYAYLGPFSWTQRTFKVKSEGHLEL